jgi:hypothetical protein
MKEYGGVDVEIHICLTSVLVGDEWSISRPGRFSPRERAPFTHWIGGWVGPRAGLDDVEKRKFLTLPGLEQKQTQIVSFTYVKCGTKYGKCIGHPFRTFLCPITTQKLCASSQHVLYI